MKQTDRENRAMALRWWSIKSIDEKTELLKKTKFSERDFSTLTGRELELIWRNQYHNDKTFKPE